MFPCRLQFARLVAFGLFLGPIVAQAAAKPAPTIEALLRAAGQIRSSSSPQFRRLLADLDQRAGEESPAQQREVAYLHAYAMIRSPDRLQEGVALAKRLFSESRDPDLKFRAGMLVANSAAITRNFAEGLRYLQRAMALRDRVTDKTIRNDGTNAAAILYNELGQYALGLYYANTTLADQPGPRAQCFARQLKVDAQYHLGNLAGNDAQALEAIRLCTENNEPIVANFVRASLARQWAADGRRRKDAIQLLRTNLGDVEATRYPRLIVAIDSLLAQMLLQERDFDSAERFATAAIEQRQGLETTLQIAQAYEVLSQVAQHRGDLQSALVFYRKYAAANVAYVGDVKARELSYYLVRRETEQKSQQITLLNRQNSLLQLQRRVDQQKAANSRLLMLLFAVFTLIMAYWAYKTRRLHASLRRMAETDALTGICNRRQFTAKAEGTLVQCARDAEQVSLIMFDLDHFKVINDNHGHATGDWVLKEVAKTCAELCRSVDLFGRFGGEEFAILLQGCDLRAATRIAEDYRLRIARIQLRESGFTFRITASCGVSCTTMAGYDLDTLLSQADQMLYRAKREGRNRVKTYAHDLPAEGDEAQPRRQNPLHPGVAATSVGAVNL